MPLATTQNPRKNTNRALCLFYQTCALAGIICTSCCGYNHKYQHSSVAESPHKFRKRLIHIGFA